MSWRKRNAFSIGRLPYSGDTREKLHRLVRFSSSYSAARLRSKSIGILSSYNSYLLSYHPFLEWWLQFVRILVGKETKGDTNMCLILAEEGKGGFFSSPLSPRSRWSLWSLWLVITILRYTTLSIARTASTTTSAAQQVSSALHCAAAAAPMTTVPSTLPTTNRPCSSSYAFAATRVSLCSSSSPPAAGSAGAAAGRSHQSFSMMEGSFITKLLQQVMVGKSSRAKQQIEFTVQIIDDFMFILVTDFVVAHHQTNDDGTSEEI